MHRTKALEITDLLKPAAAHIIAQWIGCAGVIYNQKARDAKTDYIAWLEGGKKGERPAVNAAASPIAKREGLDFLLDVPAQIRRNAASQFFQAMQAAKKGLRKAPRVRKKSQKRSCYVTNEVFDVCPRDADSCYIQFKRSARNADRGQYFAGFVMPFPANRAAKSLTLSRQGRRYWLSMAWDKGNEQPTPREIAETLQALPRDDLAPLVVGIDVGVARLATSSEGTVYHSDADELTRIEQLEQRRKRYQRRYARLARANDRTAGTKKRKRTKGEQRAAQKIADAGSKLARIRKNRAHHISKAIAESAPAVAVFEDIKLQNMTRRAKAKQGSDTGKWLRNGARAKSGLNRAILSMNLGQMRDLVEYKLAERGKLFVKVPAAYSSQECSACHHVAKENRKTQAGFACVACDHTENADVNAARVVRSRGIDLVLSGKLATVRTAKRIAVRRKSKAHDLASPDSREQVSRAQARSAL